MTTANEIVEMLKNIDSKAKFTGIKLTMIKNLLEKYRNNRELLEDVLRLTRGTHLHDLILEAYPQLQSLEKELELEYSPYESAGIGETLEDMVKENENGNTTAEDLPPIAFIKDYLKRYYFEDNIGKIFYNLGKEYAFKLRINDYDKMKKFIKENFGEEVIIEDANPLTIIVKNSKECWGVKSSSPACHLIAGFIAGCLENISDKRFVVDVVEEECRAMGDPYCVFVVAKMKKIR
jgi:predicted hydrocarbon binding protein